jgi:hypothetical protein
MKTEDTAAPATMDIHYRQIRALVQVSLYGDRSLQYIVIVV